MKVVTRYWRRLCEGLVVLLPQGGIDTAVRPVLVWESETDLAWMTCFALSSKQMAFVRPLKSEKVDRYDH